MKQLLLMGSLLVLAGCYSEDVYPIEQPTAHVASVDVSELEYAISLEGVELVPFENNSATSIQEYIDNNNYMAYVYGGMEIVDEEASFLQAVEASLHAFDPFVAILLKQEEMPLVELEALYKKLMNTDDQISATLLWYGYSIERVDEGIFIEIYNEFTTNQYEYRQVGERMDELNETLEIMNLSDYEKVETLYRYVMERMTYKDLGTNLAHSPMGFLLHGEGVCQAYAVSLHMLLERAGIESRYIIGTIHDDWLNEGESGAHAWNMVQLDGSWYHLDATWDDDLEEWENFLVSDTWMSFSRSWEKEYYPSAEVPYEK